MSKRIQIEGLSAVKNRLSPLVFVDLRNYDLVTAHRKLGQEVREQVHKILRRKLNKLSDAKLVDEVRWIRHCLGDLRGKAFSARVDPRVCNALAQYLESLASWGQGAQLDAFQHGNLDRLEIDGQPVSATELALWLQDDCPGCQTGVYREPDGSVILWHTEEDLEPEPFARFDRARLASFRVQDEGDMVEINAFIYPDILPGPAFCWRSDAFAHAVDSLYVKPQKGNYMLANIATWVIMRLGNQVGAGEVISALAPFVDAYALMVVGRQGDRITAENIEFAGDQILITSLPQEPASYLFQANIFSDKDSPIAVTYEHIDPHYWRKYAARVTRTERAMGRIRASENVMESLHALMASREGGDYAYANEDVKACYLNRVSRQGMEIWIAAGPAIQGEEPTKILVPG